jgi:hypothetical protein
MEDFKGTGDNTREVNDTNVFLTHDEKSPLILNGFYRNPR